MRQLTLTEQQQGGVDRGPRAGARGPGAGARPAAGRGSVRPRPSDHPRPGADPAAGGARARVRGRGNRLRLGGWCSSLPWVTGSSCPGPFLAGSCALCVAGLTSKCSATANGSGAVAAYGFGPAFGSHGGGMVSDGVARAVRGRNVVRRARRGQPAGSGERERQPDGRLPHRGAVPPPLTGGTGVLIVERRREEHRLVRGRHRQGPRGSSGIDYLDTDADPAAARGRARRRR